MVILLFVTKSSDAQCSSRDETKEPFTSVATPKPLHVFVWHAGFNPPSFFVVGPSS